MRSESKAQGMIKSTGIYSIAVIGSRMAGFLLIPVYTRYLTPSDYGVLELLDLSTFIFSTLIGMRFAESLFYYYASATTARSRQEIISTAFWGSTLLGILGAGIGYLVAPALSSLVFGSGDYVFYFRLSLLSMAFSFTQELGFCYMRALNRSGTYVITSLTKLLCSIALNVILLCFAGLGITGLLWSSVLISAAVAAYMAVYCRPMLFLNHRLCFQMFRYAAPLAVSGLALWFIHFGDRFFLRRWVSLADIGIYALAYKFGMLVSYAHTPFITYWRSQVFYLVRRSDGEKIYVRTATYLALVLTFIAVLLSLFIKPLLEMMAGPSFAPAGVFVPWIAGAYVIRALAEHSRTIFIIEGKTRRDAQVTCVGALMCLLGYAGFIPFFKIWGAVAATGLAFSLMFVFGLRLGQGVRYFYFEYRRWVQVVLIAGLVVTGFYLVSPQMFWTDIGLGILFACLYPAMLCLVGFWREDERNALSRILHAITARRMIQGRIRTA